LWKINEKKGRTKWKEDQISYAIVSCTTIAIMLLSLMGAVGAKAEVNGDGTELADKHIVDDCKVTFLKLHPTIREQVTN